GTGFFYAVEMMADRDTGAELTPEASTQVLTEVIPKSMKEAGLITRPDNRGATMLVLSPPLVADQTLLDDLLDKVDHVMSAVDKHLSVSTLSSAVCGTDHAEDAGSARTHRPPGREHRARSRNRRDRPDAPRAGAGAVR